MLKIVKNATTYPFKPFYPHSILTVIYSHITVFLQSKTVSRREEKNGSERRGPERTVEDKRESMSKRRNVRA